MTTWQAHSEKLTYHLLAESWHGFLNWPTIRATMYVGSVPWVRTEWEVLCASDPTRYWPAVTEPVFHATPPDWSLVHQAYHLHQWETIANTLIGDWPDTAVVSEFGAGYGALGYVIARLGYQGAYDVYDLSPLHRLQQYFWESVDPPVSLEPPMSDHVPTHHLVVGLYSLSEAPIPTRDLFLDWLLPSAPSVTHYLFAVQHTWDGVDNDAWFQGLAASRPHHVWRTLPAMHGPDSMYVVGVPG